MKKITVLLAIALCTFGIAFGQNNVTSEVLYFKANLGCCKARSCNALQADVDSVLIKYFAEKNIQFRVINIAEEAQADLVKKHNAEPQTVVLVTKKNDKEKVVDLTPIVAYYKKTGDKALFEKEMKKKIKKAIK